MARQGYRDQQGGGADTVADNLDRPVGGRLASHGRFDDEARATAVAVPADLLRVAAGAAFVGAAALTQGLGLVASLMARAVRRP